MGDGIGWAREQEKQEVLYSEHRASGKFNKEYLEADILNSLSEEEISTLVTRLILRKLGGFNVFLKKNNSSLSSVFNSMSNKDKRDFLKQNARKLDMVFEPKKKLEKFKEQAKKLLSTLD